MKANPAEPLRRALAGGSRWRPRQRGVRLRLGRTKHQAERRLRALRVGLLADHPGAKDDVDQCVETFAAEVDAAVLDLEAASLRRIEQALHQVAAGSYGLCAECGAEISAARLRALPFADLCRQCQMAREADAAAGCTPAVRT